MEAMKLKEMNGANFLSYKDIYPVMHKTKTFVIISLHGFEKKVMLSTGKYPRALKNDPVFEFVSVTSGQQNVSEIEQLDKVPLEIERRGRGRPSTGKALSPAEKQARYRARKALKSVTVTFNRDAVEALDLHIRALASGHDVSIEPDKLKSILESIRLATQSQLVSGA